MTIKKPLIFHGGVAPTIRIVQNTSHRGLKRHKVERLEFIADAFEHTHVKTLNLSDNFWKPNLSNMEKIIKALKNTMVETVMLRSNSFGRTIESATLLAGAIEETNVRTIDISDNGFGQMGSEEQDKILGKAIARSKVDHILINHVDINPKNIVSLEKIPFSAVREAALEERQKQTNTFREFFNQFNETSNVDEQVIYTISSHLVARDIDNLGKAIKDPEKEEAVTSLSFADKLSEERKAASSSLCK